MHIAFSAHSPTTDGASQEQPGFWGIQYIGKFNFRYTVFYICGNLGIKHSLTTNLGEKYTVVFLILVFYTSFSIIFDILEGLFRVFWYFTTPLADPDKSHAFSPAFGAADRMFSTLIRHRLHVFQ